jgi:hypothetical protein
MALIPLLMFLMMLLSTAAAMEFGSSKMAVSAMLKEHSSCIEEMKRETSKVVRDMNIEPYCNDVFYLRFCVSNDFESDEDCLEAFRDHLKWRHQEGKQVCDAARAAASEATKEGWDYEPIHKGAPNSILNNFLTPQKVLTILLPRGDVMFLMNHGQIDDKALMKSISSPKDVVDFMIYAKEVNSIMANQRSLESDRLAFVLTANNLNGASLATGDRGFRNALNESARLAAKHYPSLTGPTLMLNLPSWLTPVARAFAPSEVSHTMTFAQGPLKNVEELTDIASDGPERADFFTHLNKLVYSSEL